MARGWLSWLGIGNSVTLPSTVMRPTRLPAASLNHKRAVAHHDRQRFCARRNAVGKFADPAVRRDAADAADFGLGKPDIAVGTEDHAVRPGIRRRQGEFRDVAARRDAADLVGGFFRKPQIAVAAHGDADRRCVRGRQVELAEGTAIRIEPADLRRAALAEPQSAVRSLDRDIGLAAGARNPVLADGYMVRRLCAPRAKVLSSIFQP